MTTKFEIKTDDFPFRKQGRWQQKSEYPLLNVVRDFVWVIRLFSPISWISPFFSFRQRGIVYSHPYTGEVYMLVSFAITTVMLVATDSGWIPSSIVGVWSVLILLEILQYQAQTVFLRPVFQENYRPYSAERSLIILAGQYIHTLVAFANLYVCFLSNDFKVLSHLSGRVALEYSMVTMTTLGYGNIYASPGSLGALVSGVQAMVGVFFLGLFVSIGVSRTAGDHPPIRLRQPKRRSPKDWLEEAGYLSTVSRLIDAFDKDLWLVGGWVRNHALGHEYVGDVDCLTTKPPQKIELALDSGGFDLVANSKGAFRVMLPDGNHIDISSTFSHSESGSLIDAIGNFNFTINAAAFNPTTSQWISTEENRVHMAERSFDFLHYDEDTENYRVLRDFEELVKVEQIRFAGSSDVIANRLDGINKSFQVDPTTNLNRYRSRLAEMVPSLSDAWIVRGYARCSFLEELKYWDDIDVVVESDSQALFEHLRSKRIPFVLNFFGNPKIELEDGVRIDVWSLPEGTTLSQHLDSFPHTCDMLAWSIKERSLAPSTEIFREQLAGRRLVVGDAFLSNAAERDVSYCIIKTIYLVIRHQMKLDQTTAHKLFQNQLFTDGLLQKNLRKLCGELRLCGFFNIENELQYIEDLIGDHEAVRAYKRQWNNII